MIYLVFIAAVLALGFAAFNFVTVKRMPEGTKQMQEISGAIRVGANAFIHYEYRILYTVVAAVAVLLAVPSCDWVRYPRALVEADSLAESNPREALAKLAEEFGVKK